MIAVYARPSAFWLATLAGLVLALLYDGPLDTLAVALLVWPLFAVVRHVTRAVARP